MIKYVIIVWLAVISFIVNERMKRNVKKRE